jgi:type III secretion protein N (ATPase)
VRSLLDGHVILSRKLAARGHYPAIDILTSQSRLMGQLVEDGARRAALSFRAMLAKLDEIELLLQVGDYKPGQDALADRAIARRDEMTAFLRQPTHDAQPLLMTRTILRGFEG